MSPINLKCLTSVLHYTDQDVIAILAKYDRKPETIHDDVETIKQWIKEQPHIPCCPSDRQIVSFLLRNKFSIESTKTKLDMNYTIRSLIPEIYTLPLEHPDLATMNKACTYVPLPKLTKNLNRIMVNRCENPNLFLGDAFITLAVHGFEMRTLADLQISDEYIFDSKNVTPAWVTKFSFMDLKRLNTVVEKVYSNRVAAIHMINLHSYAEPFINLFKSMLKQKLQDRFLIHNSIESLQEYLPKNVLPKDYGGDLEPLEEIKENWFKYLKENQEYLNASSKVRVDESLRPTKLANDDILGYHGNFRNLQVD